MAEYVTLLGAEDVRSAGYAIKHAAVDMQNAAASIEESLRRHEQFLDDWLQRFTVAIEATQPGGEHE